MGMKPFTSRLFILAAITGGLFLDSREAHAVPGIDDRCTADAHIAEAAWPVGSDDAIRVISNSYCWSGLIMASVYAPNRDRPVAQLSFASGKGEHTMVATATSGRPVVVLGALDGSGAIDEVTLVELVPGRRHSLRKGRVFVGHASDALPTWAAGVSLAVATPPVDDRFVRAAPQTAALLADARYLFDPATGDVMFMRHGSDKADDLVVLDAAGGEREAVPVPQLGGAPGREPAGVAAIAAVDARVRKAAWVVLPRTTFVGRASKLTLDRGGAALTVAWRSARGGAFVWAGAAKGRHALARVRGRGRSPKAASITPDGKLLLLTYAEGERDSGTAPIAHTVAVVL